MKENNLNVCKYTNELKQCFCKLCLDSYYVQQTNNLTSIGHGYFLEIQS